MQILDAGAKKIGAMLDSNQRFTYGSYVTNGCYLGEKSRSMFSNIYELMPSVVLQKKIETTPIPYIYHESIFKLVTCASFLLVVRISVVWPSHCSKTRVIIYVKSSPNTFPPTTPLLHKSAETEHTTGKRLGNVFIGVLYVTWRPLFDLRSSITPKSKMREWVND